MRRTSTTLAAAIGLGLSTLAVGGHNAGLAQSPPDSIEWTVADTLLPKSDGVVTPVDDKRAVDVLAPLDPARPTDVVIRLISSRCSTSPRVEWTIGPQTAVASCRFATKLPEGSYRVVARIAAQRVRYERTIVIQNFVIASIGDSNGSGEGNKPKDEEWANADCDRSRLAGSAQAAHGIERDPHSSVTLIHLACSGARLHVGLFGAYNGMSSDGVTQPPQLRSLKTVLNGAELDALIVSIGINNMGDNGFGELIGQCVASVTNCADTTDQESAAVAFARNLRPMEQFYRQFASCLSTDPTAPCLAPDLRVPTDPKRIYATEYPDLASDDDGQICEAFGGAMTQAEFEWTRTAGRTLNAALSRITSSLGFRFVGGIAKLFVKHGYCATTERSYVVTFPQSVASQHDKNGAFHPNEYGHLVTSLQVLRFMRPDLLPGGFPRPPGNGEAVSPTVFIDEANPPPTVPPTKPVPKPAPPKPPSAALATALRGCADDVSGALRLTTARCDTTETTVRWSVPVGATGPTPPALDERALPICIDSTTLSVRVLHGGSVETRSCTDTERGAAWSLRGPAAGQPPSTLMTVLCTTAARTRLLVDTLAPTETPPPCASGETRVAFLTKGPQP